jgi:hypothetical protein
MQDAISIFTYKIIPFIFSFTNLVEVVVLLEEFQIVELLHEVLDSEGRRDQV